MPIENNMNNYNKVTLKYFGEEGTYLEAEEEGMETKDVLDIACELAFNTVGYGLKGDICGHIIVLIVVVGILLPKVQHLI